MDTSVGLSPSKLRTDEVSFEEPESIEVSVESSLSTEVSFGPQYQRKDYLTRHHHSNHHMPIKVQKLKVHLQKKLYG